MSVETGDQGVVGRLRKGPVLIFGAVALALTAVAIWETAWGEGFAYSMFYHLLGEFLGPLMCILGLIATLSAVRMWMQRPTYLRYDNERLYRGSTSWPRSQIQSVLVTRNSLGIRSIRLRTLNASQPELAKAYMLIEEPEQVCDALSAWLARPEALVAPRKRF